MLFTYWTGSDAEQLPSTMAWRERFPGYRIFGDADVLPLLDDDLRELYQRIALPACKSDIARIALLREHGGLYMDAHTGPSDGDRLAETMARLATHELLLFTRSWQCKNPGELHLMNGVIGARLGSSLLTDILRRAFVKLSQHREVEDAARDHVPYGLGGLSGTCVILDCFFNYNILPYPVRPEFQNRIFVDKMPKPGCSGFEVYKFYGYREPGQHWSERQKTERLFLAA